MSREQHLPARTARGIAARLQNGIGDVRHNRHRCRTSYRVRQIDSIEESTFMRAIPMVVLIGLASLTGCETTPPAVADAKPAAQTATSQSRCEKREVTGSRLTRCDSGPSDVRAITREEIEATGMPTGGPGKGSGDGR